MRIDITCTKIGGLLINIFVWVWLLGSFPVNYYMMQNEWGVYNNDANMDIRT